MISSLVTEKASLKMNVLDVQKGQFVGIIRIVDGKQVSSELPISLISDLQELLGDNLTVSPDGVFVRRCREVFQALKEVGLPIISSHISSERKYGLN